MRKLLFVGRSREDLRAFPQSARKAAGGELENLQKGAEPNDWKPMKTVGPGVAEIRIQDQTGAYRVIYIAKLKDAIYVLHCFEKKSQKTGRADIALASARYRSLVRTRPGN